MPEPLILAERSVEKTTITIAAVSGRFQCTIVDPATDRSPTRRRYRGRTLDDLVAIALSEERRIDDEYGHPRDAVFQEIREAIYDAQDANEAREGSSAAGA